MRGDDLPRIVAPPPGPASRRLAERLSRVESPNITQTEAAVFWAAARGANVEDVDGNVYIDLTAGFSVAAAGHANERVAAAVAEQAKLLPHALGDIHPARLKVELLERLAALAPGELSVSILASAGAEAVEAALKTAVLATGRPGIVAFEGGYHGLTYGALACTWREDFRAPFRAQLYDGVRFAPFPYAFRWAGEGDVSVAALAALERILEEAEGSAAPVGAVLLEPIQGRGGLVVPPPGFLAGVRRITERRGLVLIFDEVYTGFGRTGRWFACEHEGVVPDILVVGKALSGMLPLSAAIGTPAVMRAWPPSRGEAVHTSTFLGSPLAAAAALAQLREIEELRLPDRAAALGARLGARLETWVERFPAAGETRGRGLLRGVELVEDRETRRPGRALALAVVDGALRSGVLLLAEGGDLNVLAFVPPLVITERQLDHALDVVEHELARRGG